MLGDHLEVLISEERIQEANTRLAKEIESTYSHLDLDTPLLIGTVLKGGFVFGADLIRRIQKIPVELEFIELSSYEGTESTEQIHWHKDFRASVRGRELLIIEDIVDTGLTMKSLRKILKERFVQSLRVCSLLSKPSRRKTDVEIEFLGFEIEDHFVVGYGLDYNQRYRNLPAIYKVKDGGQL